MQCAYRENINKNTNKKNCPLKNWRKKCRDDKIRVRMIDTFSSYTLFIPVSIAIKEMLRASGCLGRKEKREKQHKISYKKSC